MDHHRQNLLAVAIAAAVLARAHRAFDHRIDDFQVRRIERQRQMHRAARRDDVRRKAHVILDVARRQIVGVLAFELGEQVLGHLAHGVHQHVEAAAMGHADHGLLDRRCSPARCSRDVEQRNQAVAAFQREALLADVARVQILLQGFRRGQALQDVALLIRRIAGRGAHALEARLDPALLRNVADVHVLDADRAAIGFAHRAQDLAQRHLLRAHQRAGVEHRVHVGFGQAVESGLQLGNLGLGEALQRIESA